MVLWSYGPVVLWSYGPMVLWSYGPMVLWSYGPMVLWSYGQNIASHSRCKYFSSRTYPRTKGRTQPPLLFRSYSPLVPLSITRQ
ncbi:hypothetical protein C9I90_21395 [Photobacterium aphoticum]|nr:hypothetical protein C9I90_21395 [Photobacterium aphoticum]